MCCHVIGLTANNQCITYQNYMSTNMNASLKVKHISKSLNSTISSTSNGGVEVVQFQYRCDAGYLSAADSAHTKYLGCNLPTQSLYTNSH